jgi:hypothetical protein
MTAVQSRGGHFIISIHICRRITITSRVKITKLLLGAGSRSLTIPHIGFRSHPLRPSANPPFRRISSLRLARMDFFAGWSWSPSTLAASSRMRSTASISHRSPPLDLEQKRHSNRVPFQCQNTIPAESAAVTRHRQANLRQLPQIRDPLHDDHLHGHRHGLPLRAPLRPPQAIPCPCGGEISSLADSAAAEKSSC